MSKINVFRIITPIVAFIILQFFVVNTLAQQRDIKSKGKTRALLLQGYSDDLNYTKNDIKSMRGLLRKKYFGPINKISEFIDPKNNVQAFKDQLKDLENKLSSGDKLIIFYTGHGSPLNGNDSYLLLGKEESIRMSFLVSYLERLANRKVKSLLIVDACYSGRYFNKIQVREMPEIVYILSSQGNEIAMESNRLKNGVLTQFLKWGVEGRANKGQNKKGNLEITVGEIKKYLDKKASKFVKRYFNRVLQYYQNPLIIGNNDEIIAYTKERRKVIKSGKWFPNGIKTTK